MPKIIQTSFEVIPEEAVLVRSAYLRNDIRASTLLKEAQRRARDLMLSSEDQAEKLYREAKMAGYAAGILGSAGVMTDYLREHANLAAQMEASMKQKIEKILRYCISDIESDMSAFEECIGLSEKAGASGVDVLLPESLRHCHGNLLKRLQALVTAPVNIEYHAENRFVFRYGDGVLECAPDEFVAHARLRVMDDLPSIYASNRGLAEKCRDSLAALFERDAEDCEMPLLDGDLMRGGA